MLNTGVVSFSPTTAPLTFPAQAINTVSKQQILKLKNQGKASISISSIKLTGPFALKTSCAKSLAAGATCSLSVTFDPKATGTANGLITINDSASSKPQFVDLTGTATVVEVAPASLTFPSENIGKRSAPQIVTAINEGKTAITFKNVYIGGKDDKDFSATGNCTGSLAPGASCQMSVTFDPTEGGARNAALYFDLPTGSISPAPVALSGTGD
jgi:Abnormal spindle-like microcephaly-assoc'd, ASPM-SPD-2-Hydin